MGRQRHPTACQNEEGGIQREASNLIEVLKIRVTRHLPKEHSLIQDSFPEFVYLCIIP